MSDLLTVKVGDQLIRHNSLRRRQVLVVKRLTKTQIIITDDLRFSKKTGHVVGGGICTIDYVSRPGLGEIAEVKLDNRRRTIIAQIGNKAVSNRFSDWTTCDLEDLHELITQGEKNASATRHERNNS